MLPDLNCSSATPSIRILVVDDKPSVVESICQFFGRQTGVTVMGVGYNGHEAIEKAAVCEPDLVVMDVHMPRMDGLEAARTLRLLRPAVRIILISLDQSALVQENCLRQGADRFLPKIGLQRSLMTAVKDLFPEHFEWTLNAVMKTNPEDHPPNP